MSDVRVLIGLLMTILIAMIGINDLNKTNNILPSQRTWKHFLSHLIVYNLLVSWPKSIKVSYHQLPSSHVKHFNLLSLYRRSCLAYVSNQHKRLNPNDCRRRNIIRFKSEKPFKINRSRKRNETMKALTLIITVKLKYKFSASSFGSFFHPSLRGTRIATIADIFITWNESFAVEISSIISMKTLRSGI